MIRFQTFQFCLPFLFTALLAQGQTLQKGLTITPGKRLEVNLETGGTLRISGWAKNRVEVTCKLQGRDADACVINLEEMANAAKLSSRYIGTASSVQTSLVFEVHVPRSFNLLVNSSGGAVSIHDVEGFVQVDTAGGAIWASGMSGFYSLATNGGDIRVGVLDGHLRASTASGRIQVDISPEIADINRRREIKVSSSGGDLTVTVPDEIHGEASVDLDGKPAHTMNNTLSMKRDEQSPEESPRTTCFGSSEQKGGNATVKIDVDATGGSVFLKRQGLTHTKATE